MSSGYAGLSEVERIGEEYTSVYTDNYIPDNAKFEKVKKYNNYYMRQAYSASRMSYCKRKKVGAIVVKDGAIIADSWNGMPSGMDNCCEEDGVTKLEVLHAEENSIMKITRSNNSSVGAEMFCTLSPCINCARLIYNAGITKLHFREQYRGDEGVKFLESVGVEVNHMASNPNPSSE